MLKQERSNETTLSRKNPWTIVHSFYANMGGYVIDSYESGAQEFIPGSPRLTLTAAGVIRLAECAQLPDISESSIKDRSKADHLAKALVCVQAGWMIVQCVTRVASRLPVTFLEINTLAHVLCAFLTYVFWWHKPLDIRDPTVIHGEEIPELCALMYMCSKISTQFPRGDSRCNIPEIEALIYYDTNDKSGVVNDASSRSETASNQFQAPSLERQASSVISYNEDQSATHRNKEAQNHNVLVQKKELPNHSCVSILDFEGFRKYVLLPEPAAPSRTIVSLYNGQSLAGTRLGPFERSKAFEPIRISAEEYNSHFATSVTLGRSGEFYGKPYIVVHLDPTHIKRWQLAARVMSKYFRLGIDSGKTFNLYGKQFLEYCALDWPGLYGDGVYGPDNLPFIAISMAAAAYGGLHASAWRNLFPTAIEGLLWKISSLLITSSGFCFCFYLTLIRLYHETAILDSFHNVIQFLQHPVFRYLAYTFGCLIFAVYAAARLFLVLEAFISLREMPIDVYTTPTWTQFLPHL